MDVCKEAFFVLEDITLTTFIIYIATTYCGKVKYHKLGKSFFQSSSVCRKSSGVINNINCGLWFVGACGASAGHR